MTRADVVMVDRSDIPDSELPMAVAVVILCAVAVAAGGSE